jgi:peptidoglycan/LPS O-acetylase OafA/YrhL
MPSGENPDSALRCDCGYDFATDTMQESYLSCSRGKGTRALRWVFPIRTILAIGGVFLDAVLEKHSFENTSDWKFEVLSGTFLPSLLGGTLLAIVGSFIDRTRLRVAQTRARGISCLVVSGISFLLLAAVSNVHDWTISFVFPAFGGFVAGAVLLSKLNDRVDKNFADPFRHMS